MFRPRLLTPGPVEVSPAVLSALVSPQIHHRSPVAKQLIARARELLRWLYAVPDGSGFEPLLLTTSGTGAFEAALASLVPDGALVASLSAGKFGERWAAMARALGYEVAEERFPWGKVIPPMAASALLQAHPETKALLVTHSETSTGVLHDLAAIVQAARAVNPELLVIVDAVTSLGVSELRPAEWQLDAVVSGSQKGTAAPPGLGMVLLSPRALERMLPQPRAYALNLRRELAAQINGETAYTPAINLIAALVTSLEMLMTNAGPQALWQERSALNEALLAAAVALGCTSFAERPSPACVTLVPPAPIDGRSLVKALLERGARAQGGQDAIKDSICRISLMGHFDRYDCLAVAGLLEEALADCGVQATRGIGVAAAWARLAHE